MQHFAHIMGMTEVQEGIIVRCIQRLDELLKDVRTAAGIVGNPELRTMMEEASKLIRRDIVFAASLYLQWGRPSVRAIMLLENQPKVELACYYISRILPCTQVAQHNM